MFPTAVRYLVILSTISCIYGENFTNVVDTEYGPVRGKIVTLSNGLLANNYLAFPFARANRYERPTAPAKWTTVLNATEHGVMCPQFLIPGLPKSMVPSEDCLTVSVYTPASANETSNLPVMHWIHGGGYMFGFGSLYDGSFLAAERNVVVVVTQYRVGSFGWLSTGTKELSGNYGLFDMLQGLKWTKANIRKFGGNPSKVTLFGQSAGGMAVSTLMLSPLTEGLFDNVIIQSGYANMILAVMQPDEALQSAKALAEKFNCTDMSKLKECLSSQPMIELVNKQSQIPAREFLPVFAPVVDKDFLPDLPINLIANGNFRKTNVIVGFTDDDGGTLLQTAPALFRGLKTDNGVTRKDYVEYVKRTTWVRGQTESVVDAIIKEYTNWKDIDNVNKTRRNVFNLATDIGFRVPALVASKAFAKKKMNTFVYQFDYRLPLMFDGKKKPKWMGAYHGADLPYTFGTEAPFLRFAASFGDDSKNLGLLFRTYLKNFAETGNPNSANVKEWPKFVSGGEKVVLMHPNSTVVEDLVNDKVLFWEETIPSLMNSKKPPSSSAGEKKGSQLLFLVVMATSILISLQQF